MTRGPEGKRAPHPRLLAEKGTLWKKAGARESRRAHVPGTVEFRWQIRGGVFRFIVSRILPPGVYDAMAKRLGLPKFERDLLAVS